MLLMINNTNEVYNERCLPSIIILEEKIKRYEID